jgi:hypothetical protein
MPKKALSSSDDTKKTKSTPAKAKSKTTSKTADADNAKVLKVTELGG